METNQWVIQTLESASQDLKYNNVPEEWHAQIPQGERTEAPCFFSDLSLCVSSFGSS